ncbi:MAG: PilT/PilU family type 4a pilus ATPase [Planctomycetales bacterium]|nr:PilT/PilU family type 4a pilus ATPase [Planctomycetales bacterium]
MTNESLTPAERLFRWLSEAVACGASDLHLAAGHRPTLRVNGILQQLPDSMLGPEEVRTALVGYVDPRVLAQIDEEKNADFALELDVGGSCLQRFRANVFASNDGLGACFRVIKSEIPDMVWAGFPEELAQRLAHFRNGLVLFSGVTGSGKTTSLAMVLNLLNQEGGNRIITVEEPVEYVFPRCSSSIVTQREVGKDVATFADGLKYGLRQDPDVILVGEIRDQDTAQIALSAAETGHLVFSTLHTRDAKGAISRFSDLFPQSAQPAIRAQLAMSLRAVISQHLLPSWPEGGKRELALEVLFNTSPMASAIRMGKLESIDTNIITGRADGMVPLDESVRQLLEAGKITAETAELYFSEKRR